MAHVPSDTTRATLWKAIYTLINNNKLTGWTVTSAFPEGKSVFPCVVINPLKISHLNMAIDRSKRMYDIECKFELYASTTGRKETIDQGKDNIQNTILSNLNYLATNGIVYTEFKDIGDDTWSIDEESQLNTAEIQVRFRGA